MLPHKVEGIISVITFVSIVINSGVQQLCINFSSTYSIETLVLANLIKKALNFLCCLIGHLNHAAAVVVPGRTFFHHLIELSCTVRHIDHHIPLQVEACSDLPWWLLLVENWKG